MDHALRYAQAVPAGVGPGAVAVDLGSGAGLPALPLALAWPGSTWTLVEASARRVAFLEEATAALGIAERVQARQERAEDVGRDPAARGAADLVVARSFGRPAVVAECAAPLLRPGGALVVSEPPGGDDRRWPPSALARLGLEAEGLIAGCQVLTQVRPCSEEFPRRVGVPGKRPLW